MSIAAVIFLSGFVCVKWDFLWDAIMDCARGSKSHAESVFTRGGSLLESLKIALDTKAPASNDNSDEIGKAGGSADNTSPPTIFAPKLPNRTNMGQNLGQKRHLKLPGAVLWRLHSGAAEGDIEMASRTAE